ncbi:hypothetical protein TrRE_jg9951, partial [Triparma retinervis]
MAHHTNLKKDSTEGAEKDMQKFLSSSQYDYSNIFMYERCFGQGFMSAGGLDTTAEYISMLNLKRSEGSPPLKVLDVGSGVCGSAFYLALTFGASVTALDLSTTTTSLAKRRVPPEISHLVTFELGDALDMEYEDCT